MGMKIGAATRENNEDVPQKKKKNANRTTIRFRKSILGINGKKTKTLILKYVCNLSSHVRMPQLDHKEG